MGDRSVGRQSHHQRTFRRQLVEGIQLFGRKRYLFVRVLEGERQNLEVPYVLSGREQNLDLRLRRVGDELVMLGKTGQRAFRLLHAHRRFGARIPGR